MAAADSPHNEQTAICGCFRTPYQNLIHSRDLGMDEHFAEASLLVCSVCGQHWLKYLFEVEAFTGSGRWYLGAIPAEQAARLTAPQAKTTLESLSWYFYGGSYYQGRSGRTSGSILLNP
jgi:hypothetical protein